jgi:branched-chain amino acid transport system permease protein
MFATYMSWAMVQAGYSYWTAFVVVLAGSFVTGMVIERVIFRPLESRHE